MHLLSSSSFYTSNKERLTKFVLLHTNTYLGQVAAMVLTAAAAAAAVAAATGIRKEKGWCFGFLKGRG